MRRWGERDGSEVKRLIEKKLKKTPRSNYLSFPDADLISRS